MVRVMISVDADIARRARMAAAQQGTRISVVAENALKAFVAESSARSRRRKWPAPIGKRSGTVQALVDAINRDQA